MFLKKKDFENKKKEENHPSDLTQKCFHFKTFPEISGQCYSEKWKEQKKFAVQALRTSGFGTSASEGKIQTQVYMYFCTAGVSKRTKMGVNFDQAV